MKNNLHTFNKIILNLNYIKQILIIKNCILKKNNYKNYNKDEKLRYF